MQQAQQRTPAPPPPATTRHHPQDGFIHLTQEAELLLGVANQFYQDVPGTFLVLALDPARLTSKVPLPANLPSECRPPQLRPSDRPCPCKYRSCSSQQHQWEARQRAPPRRRCCFRTWCVRLGLCPTPCVMQHASTAAGPAWPAAAVADSSCPAARKWVLVAPSRAVRHH